MIAPKTPDVDIDMTVEQLIDNYLAGHPEPKRMELETLHRLILGVAPVSKLWFDEGIDASGKVVSNPSIGYGAYTIRYANGTSREFYRVGLSGNKSGISVYVLGLEGKTYLANTYGATIGKATVTGYCIKFKSIKDINLEVLQAAVQFGLEE